MYSLRNVLVNTKNAKKIPHVYRVVHLSKNIFSNSLNTISRDDTNNWQEYCSWRSYSSCSFLLLRAADKKIRSDVYRTWPWRFKLNLSKTIEARDVGQGSRQSRDSQQTEMVRRNLQFSPKATTTAPLLRVSLSLSLTNGQVLCIVRFLSHGGSSGKRNRKRNNAEPRRKLHWESPMAPLWR